MDLDRSIKKEKISKPIRDEIISRDNYKCQICGKQDVYGLGGGFGMDGELNIHHIIPNGLSTLSNLITLCIKCHGIVHWILYLDRKWIRGFLK